MAGQEIHRAVPDPYALYGIALGHTPAAASLRERAADGSLSLVITALAVISASVMAGCGEPGCHGDHPADVTPLLHEFATVKGAEPRSLTLKQSVAVGALYRAQVASRYVGDIVLAACGAALVAHAEGIPLLTTPRSRYCYVAGAIDTLAARVEID